MTAFSFFPYDVYTASKLVTLLSEFVCTEWCRGIKSGVSHTSYPRGVKSTKQLNLTSMRTWDIPIPQSYHIFSNPPSRPRETEQDKHLQTLFSAIPPGDGCIKTTRGGPC